MLVQACDLCRKAAVWYRQDAVVTGGGQGKQLDGLDWWGKNRRPCPIGS